MSNNDSNNKKDQETKEATEPRRKKDFGGLKPLTAAQVIAMLINADHSAGACACGACACACGPCY